MISVEDADGRSGPCARGETASWPSCHYCAAARTRRVQSVDCQELTVRSHLSVTVGVGRGCAMSI